MEASTLAAADIGPRLRLTKVDEFQLLTCIKHDLWGSKQARFKDWRPGDLLAVLVDSYLAALGTVSGPPFKSTETVWDNAIFPNRIPVNFTTVLMPEERPAILGEVRDALATAFPSGGYGLAILNQWLVPGFATTAIVKAFAAPANSAAYVRSHMTELLAAADATRSKRKSAKRPADPRPESNLTAAQSQGTPVLPDAEAESVHSRIQAHLIELGHLVGCSVWIAANDRNRQFRGRGLGTDCLPSLPNIGLGPEAMRRIGLIDIIWFRNSIPLYAFEVEATTSIYSGLLRMSDLLASVPTLRLKLLIVAPVERQQSVLNELARPTFTKIGLSEYCAFVPAEKLDELLVRVAGLGGHIQPSIIESEQIELDTSNFTSLADPA